MSARRQSSAAARLGPALTAAASLGLLAVVPLGTGASRASPVAAGTNPWADLPPARLERLSGSTLSFFADILPILDRHGCNAAACHGGAGGKGGLALSLFGGYPEEDYSALTRQNAGRRVDRVSSRQSLLLLKATGGATHAGGARIDPASEDARVVGDWLGEGAPWGQARSEVVKSLEVTPRVLTLAKGESRPVVVTAILASGRRRIVTADAVYASGDETIARTDRGEIQAGGYGQATVVLTYRRHSTALVVQVPQPVSESSFNLPPANRVDELVFTRLKQLGLPPSPVASDAEFLRRVHLDVVGILPTPQEAKTFLEDRDPAKRSRLVDRLLESDAFADYWALKWGDLLRIKSEYPSNLWPNGVQAYYRWVRQAIATNKPYDAFARELLVSSGSNFRDGPANYYRALRRREPEAFAEATALVFMGVRLECARCHVHPTEHWTRADTLGMAAFFAQIQFKGSQEWKEEIVYSDPERVLRDPRTHQVIPPRFFGGAAPEIKPGHDPRAVFADWLTEPENPWFARAIANRVWFWLLGRGIVHEPDDMRATNPPSHPDLLAYLQSELTGHGYDLKHLFRLILNSHTYQLSSRTTEWNARDTQLFSHYLVKRLGAEQLMDAMSRATESYEQFSSEIPEPYMVLPKGWGAIRLADGSIGTPFLQLFGRPSRDTPYENERCTQASMGQALYMACGPQLEKDVASSPRIERMLASGAADAELIEELYLATLSRPPSADEVSTMTAHMKKAGGNRKEALQDVLWVLLNTREFLFNH